ncbi:MAG: type II toxin-antitoxin system VapC family toxin [Acidobacteria bacterium]|nr:MAG: type II toxin-antitoxin system VapC family toxin [Acidobacteriota bacterium]
MAYLFDTDAISELLRPRPVATYVSWLGRVPRDEQFTSAVVVGELFKGAYRSAARERHLENIEQLILPTVTVLPFDTAVARVFGRIRAELEERGQLLADADLQIAATAVHHGLELVTGNLRHFGRNQDLAISRALIEARGPD